jgi:propionyl-CoA carboxylase alpha chain
VTELVTGLDLVEQMIRVAAGEKLAMSQEDIGIDGWSIENRVYAEDPYRGFLPSTGRLVRYQPPLEGWRDDGTANGRRGVDGVRVDDGVYEGGEVSMFYDPMIAKLVTWGKTRDEAADKQIEALDAFRLEGLGHNVDFLSAIMQHERFRSGELTTGFIAEEYPDGFTGAPANEDFQRQLAAIFARAEATRQTRAQQISGQMAQSGETGSHWAVKMADQTFDVLLEEGGATVDGHRLKGAWDWQVGDHFAAVTGDHDFIAQIERIGVRWQITTRGAVHTALAMPQAIAALDTHMLEKIPPDLSKFLICPMPGLLVKLHVAEGEEVQPGQPLATVEAMKMENILRAEKQAVVAKVNASEGESLAVDAIILEME